MAEEKKAAPAWLEREQSKWRRFELVNVLAMNTQAEKKGVDKNAVQ